MQTRLIVAGLLLASASPLYATGATFEQQVVAIMTAGGTPETIQARLDRAGAGRSLTTDQQVAMDALRTLVRSKARPKGLSVADAQAFAARNPSSPASAMLIAEAALANDEPQRSADALIAAASQSGSLVQLISPATVSKLTSRLDTLSDKERTAKLAKVLLDANWSRGSASLRSYLALAAMREEVAAGRTEAARRFLPVVRSPRSLQAILVDNRLAPLRDDVLRLAGPQLRDAWRGYLTAARDDWSQRGDAESAIAYVEALNQAGQYDVIADSFAARFMRGYNCPSDSVARSVGSELADAFAKVGRWSRAEDVMRRMGGVSAPIYASMLLERGEFGRALSLLDRSLQSAPQPKTDEDRKALAWLKATQACAAYRAGNAASPFEADLLEFQARMTALVCLDRTDDAQATLLAALASDEDRADALRWVQPFADPANQSRFHKEMADRVRALQKDSAVVAAASKVGVILDWPLTASAPKPAELPAAKPAVAWQCGDRSPLDMGAPQAPVELHRGEQP